ncbi:hypothetical protein HMN09_00976200 [Mycena chlorophos]|uniref:Uncharacterized protein n=1 Tax=Mycena chlorophos TaxID=658473 RepID=A0A8H6SHS9_MYCCL|nr:hypothetical protein HMN09_00976200 [Mycena chlorophos]
MSSSSASSSSSSISSISTQFLPLYSPSLPSPCYSVDPAYDETILDVSPYHRSTRMLPTGVFTKQSGSATVVLLNQHAGVRTPTYGRGALVKGTLMLSPESVGAVSQISVKLQGRLEITTSDAGASTTKMITVGSQIWPPPPANAAAGSASPVSPRCCPESLNFEVAFPEVFQLGDYEHPLPPTYIARFPGFPSLYAKATYDLVISIVKDRRIGFIPRTKTVFVLLEYRPESAPPRGITPTPPEDFLQAIKYMPEEWFQSSCTMRAKPKSDFSCIDCQVFMPAVRIFGFEDTIPVHVQLSGTLPTLRHLVNPTDRLPHSVSSSSSSSSISGRPTTPDEFCPVKIFLTRMVSAEHLGKLTMRVQRLGANGRVRPLPPPADFDCAECERGPTACPECIESVVVLDYTGEVRCDPKLAQVGGFYIGLLNVKDFLTVELAPPQPRTSPLIGVQHAVPIRFVTESYHEHT